MEQAVDGMAEACRELETPVIGGNVSLYNENAKGAIYPTPVVGMVGLIHDTDHITTQGFKAEGDLVYVLGETYAELGGSEFQAVVHGVSEGRPPQLDLATEKKLLSAVLKAIQSGLVQSAHDVSEGGLAAALAESCISGNVGASIALASELRSDIMLFSESQSRIVLSISPDHKNSFEQLVQEAGVPFTPVGLVGGNKLSITINGASALEESVEALKSVWEDAIPCLMN